MANKILVARGTKARIEEIKSTLATNELVYSTNTSELGVKKANGEIEYFMNAANINAIMTGKQDKLFAGDNITIDENNLISSNEIDLNMLGYMNYAADIYYRARRQSLFSNAWESSLEVDPSEIIVNSSSSSPGGKAQYPNGETEGVIIPQGVTSIGDYAFRYWRSNNQPLVIPNSVTSIGSYAFDGWSSNTQPLVIPDSITDIGNYAFRFWEANTHSLVIPESVTSIGNGAFRYWSSNNQPLVIPDSITDIGNYAFGNWESNNQPLVIPDSITSIGGSAFRNWQANTHSLVIPESVTSIGDAAFGNWESVPYVEIQAITPPTLASSFAFNTQGDAPIYVPDESVEAYKAATNWVDLADRIFSIDDK